MSDSKFFIIRNLMILKSIKGKKILENINISFEEGCVYKLSGGNGYGKTTLIRCISGITDYDFGQIKRYSGINEYEIRTEEVFKYISVFLPDTSLPKTLKVCECLELFRVVNEFKGEIGEIISFFEIEALLNKSLWYRCY